MSDILVAQHLEGALKKSCRWSPIKHAHVLTALSFAPSERPWQHLDAEVNNLQETTATARRRSQSSTTMTTADAEVNILLNLFKTVLMKQSENTSLKMKKWNIYKTKANIVTLSMPWGYFWVNTEKNTSTHLPNRYCLVWFTCKFYYIKNRDWLFSKCLAFDITRV